jgi:hypothetical protein
MVSDQKKELEDRCNISTPSNTFILCCSQLQTMSHSHT